MEVINYDVDHLTMVEKLDGGVVRGGNKISKELKDKFIMVGIKEANERKECGTCKKNKYRIIKPTLI